MIVVSDTSPINYLVLIGAVEVLPRLYGAVLVPPAVVDELSHAATPKLVSDWLASPPDWLIVQAPLAVDALERLDRGETEAIALALEVGAGLLLMDDKSGKQVANRLGINVVGTLAVLDAAAKHGFLDFAAAMSKLEGDTNFRISPALRDRLLREHTQDTSSRRQDPPA